MATLGEDPKEKAASETRDYVWKYWAFHADQRLRTFNFFILVVSVLLAGICTYLKDARYPAYASPAGFVLAFSCYVFWRLDCRNRMLIQHAEGILKSIERGIAVELVPEDRQLFSHEDVKTDKFWQNHCATRSWRPDRWWHAPLSFYSCFRLMFLIIGILGVAIGVISVFLPGQPAPASGSPPSQNFFIGGQGVKPVPGAPP